MSNPATFPAESPSPSRTRITFDLRDELSADEIEKFERAAAAAGAKNMTEHLLNLALRIPRQPQASA